MRSAIGWPTKKTLQLSLWVLCVVATSTAMSQDADEDWSDETPAESEVEFDSQPDEFDDGMQEQLHHEAGEDEAAESEEVNDGYLNDSAEAAAAPSEGSHQQAQWLDVPEDPEPAASGAEPGPNDDLKDESDNEPNLSLLEQEFLDDQDDPLPTDFTEDPIDRDISWEVQESQRGHRPFVEPVIHGNEQDAAMVRRWAGKPVALGGAPWLATLYGRATTRVSEDGDRDWNAGHQCGGVLIAEQWVLTAAHCLLGRNDEPLAVTDLGVRVGAEDLSDPEDGADYAVVRAVVHGGFSRATHSEPPNMYDNDIALLQLNYVDGETVGDPVNPIAHLGAASESDLVATANWYRYHDADEQRERALLLKFEMRVPTLNECRDYEGYDAPHKLNARVFCADNPERFVCNGDSGSPVILASGAATLVGITSWGRDTCNLMNEVGVYTRVASFELWIANAMARAAQADSTEVFIRFD